MTETSKKPLYNLMDRWGQNHLPKNVFEQRRRQTHIRMMMEDTKTDNTPVISRHLNLSLAYDPSDA
jgi:hypothetical protein